MIVNVEYLIIFLPCHSYISKILNFYFKIIIERLGNILIDNFLKKGRKEVKGRDGDNDWSQSCLYAYWNWRESIYHDYHYSCLCKPHCWPLLYQTWHEMNHIWIFVAFASALICALISYRGPAVFLAASRWQKLCRTTLKKHTLTDCFAWVCLVLPYTIQQQPPPQE